MFVLGSSVGDDVKWRSAVERALGTWESVVEWADYISFLARLQKAVKNKHRCDGPQLPLIVDISEMLTRCMEPSLPSGVHQMCLDVYKTVFEIIGPTKLALTVNIWLPGLLPSVSWAAFNVKPSVVKLFSEYILRAIPPNSRELKELYKPMFLAMLPSIEEDSADCFAEICELLVTLSKMSSDDSLYWQSLYLAIITSADCRLGALTWLQKVPPNTKEVGLFLRAICAGLEDDNVLVQRGFLDLLVKHLPLDGEAMAAAKGDKAKVMYSSCQSIFRKDMSLNRRLRLWLLGPDPSNSTDSDGNGRLAYFKKFASQTLIEVLLERIPVDLPGVCVIARGLMDRWEMSVFLGPALLKPIILQSQILGSVDNGAAAFFDNVDANVVWNTCVHLLSSHNSKAVLFMVENFKIDDEDMTHTYIPLLILYLMGLEEMTETEFQILEILMSCISHRAMPEEPEIVLSCSELRRKVADLLEDSCEISKTDQESNNKKSLLTPGVVSWYLLKLAGELVLEGKSAQPLNDVLKSFPSTPGLELTIPNTPKLIEALNASNADHVELFRFFMDKMTPRMVRSYVQSLVTDLGDTFVANGPLQFEKVSKLWELSETVPDNIVPSAISVRLADRSLSPFERAKFFADLWTLSVDQTNINTMLTKPLLLFLDISTENRPVFETYLRSSIAKTATSPRVIKLLIDKLDQESRGDTEIFTYVLERFLVLLSDRDIQSVYITKFSPLMCTLLLEWFDKAVLPVDAYEHTLVLAEKTVLDSRVKDGRVWLRRFVDALTHTYMSNNGSPGPIPVSLMSFLAATCPILDNMSDIRVFAQLSVPHIKTEVDFEAFTQFLHSILENDPGVEEDLLNKVIERLNNVELKLSKSNFICDSNLIMHLLSIVEHILSVGIDYANAHGDGNGSSGSGGGLASALAGFQLESPEDRTRVEKLHESLGRCVHSAVALGARYWLLLQRSRDFSGSSLGRRGEYSSTLHTIGRLKTRLRKLLSLCFNNRPEYTLVIVVEEVGDMRDAVKLTHMFEGPRSSNTLSILVSMSEMNAKMFEFAAAYVDSLETDAMGDVWPIMQQFLVTITSNSSSVLSSGNNKKQEHHIAPAMVLRFLVESILARIDQLRLRAQKKSFRDFAEVYCKLITMDLDDQNILAMAVKKLPMVVSESDRQASLLSKIFNLNCKTPSDLAFNIKLITATSETFSIAGTPAAKFWTRFVSDFLFETQSPTFLLPLTVDESMALKPVIRTWALCDKEKVREFISKLSVYGSGTGVLFGWTGTQELANSNLKRFAYIMVSTPSASLAVNWSKLMNQLTNMWDQNAAAACTLLRACLMSQPSANLVALVALRLQSVLAKTAKFTTVVSGSDAELLVEACKLLDLALATGIEQFQAFQWLFISDSDVLPVIEEPRVLETKEEQVQIDADTMEKSSQTGLTQSADPLTHRAGGALELLAGSPCLPTLKVSEQVTVPDLSFRSKRRPILPPRATLNDIPLFLNKLTLTVYEEVYAMTTCDREYCERWLLMDLFN